MKTVISVIALITINFAQVQTANFSGNWKRNDTQINVGGLPHNSIPISLKIIQDEQAFTMEKTSNNEHGDISGYTVTLGFVGKATETVTPNKLHRSSVLQWLSDHQILQETAISKDDQGNVIQTYVYKYNLEDQGKTMKILVTAQLRGQTYQLTEVFDKQ